MKRIVIIVILFSLLLSATPSSMRMVAEHENRSFITADEPDFPSISSPPNITYLEGEVGIWITWVVSDTTPASYNVTLDGELISYRPWDGSNISVCVDGLREGVHLYNCTVIDAFDRASADNVRVTVLDNTKPIINHPNDVFTKDASVVVEWQVYDRNPGYCEVSFNGILQDTYEWLQENDTIRHTCDLGLWSALDCRIKAVDMSGHYTEDSIMIYHDLLAPVITSPSDIEYLEGMEDISITWKVVEMLPNAYKVTRNGSVVLLGPWDGSDIVVDVSGLSQGIYYYELNVTDESNLYDIDIVKVAVISGTVPIIDTQAPLITSPNDIEYLEGVKDVSIIWKVEEMFPNAYSVTRNGTVVISGSWDGSDIVVDISGLSQGAYFYELNVTDESNQFDTDIVKVIVIDGEAPVLDHPNDITIRENGQPQTVTIRWHVFDVNPREYSVCLEFYGEGYVIQTAPWDGSDILFQYETTYFLGEYVFTLTLLDECGYSASDEVSVFVVVGWPSISSPFDVQYVEGATPSPIIWTINDEREIDYEIVRNDTAIAQASWKGEDVKIDISGLTRGTYVYEIRVWTADGFYVSDDVTVRVTKDLAPPTVDNPPDIIFFYGTAGMSIIWTCNDLNPYSYSVSHNGTVTIQTMWNSPEIAVPLDGLEVGVHEYQLALTDINGNAANDTLLVTVLSQGTQPQDTGLSLTVVVPTTLIIGIGCGALVMMLFHRRRQK